MRRGTPREHPFVLIAVGVSDYDGRDYRNPTIEHPRLQRLRFAANDARAIHKFLGARYGFSGIPAVVDAEADEIRRRLTTQVGKEVTRADTLVFYFSGHGDLQPSPRHWDDPDRWTNVEIDLCLHGKISPGLGADDDCVRLTDIVRWMVDVDARNYVLIIDACQHTWGNHTGARDPELEIGERLNSIIHLKSAGRSPASTPAANLMVLWACGPGQSSAEDEIGQTNLFTGALTKVLESTTSRCSWEEIRNRTQALVAERWASLSPGRRSAVLPIPVSYPTDLSHFEIDPVNRVFLRTATDRPSRVPGSGVPSQQEWITIPEGVVRLPSAADRTVGSFRISAFPAFHQEYESFTAKTGWPVKGVRSENHSFVSGVRLFDAEAFCQWSGVRLPTALEWQRFVDVTNSPLRPAPGFWEWIDGGAGHTRSTRNASRLDSTVERPPNSLARDLGFRYVECLPASNPPVDGLDGCVTINGGTPLFGVPENWLRHAGGLGVEPGVATRLADTFPPRKAALEGFSIRRYPVTNEEFFEFLQQQEHPAYWPATWDHACSGLGEGRPFLSRYRYHPVAGIRYEAAQAYCLWRKVRLPTSDEWELSARGEDGRLFPWGDTFDPLRANFRQTGLGRTTRVDDLYPGQASSGCLDMAGNVWEWVAESSSGHRVIRGGSHEDDGRICGLAFYYRQPHLDRPAPAGFRYVL